MITYNASGTHYHIGWEEGVDTQQLRRIMTRHLPAAMELFARKNAQYGENEFELGPAAQFPEIWRKVKLLQQMIWDSPGGRATTDKFIDSEAEVIHDLIGHCLMLLDCITPEDSHA